MPVFEQALKTTLSDGKNVIVTMSPIAKKRSKHAQCLRLQKNVQSTPNLDEGMSPFKAFPVAPSIIKL